MSCGLSLHVRQTFRIPHAVNRAESWSDAPSRTGTVFLAQSSNAAARWAKRADESPSSPGSCFGHRWPTSGGWRHAELGKERQ